MTMNINKNLKFQKYVSMWLCRLSPMVMPLGVLTSIIYKERTFSTILINYL